jgi:hypothetical protein
VTLKEEIEALQRRLLELASQVDDGLVARYELKRPPMPPGIYWRMRWLAGWLLRWLEAKGLWRPDPWPASLKQSRADARAKPLLIWAIGADRDTLRRSCEVISGLQASLPRFAPVLVTDVADFAFFSRLGWLVEYLPALTGPGEPYDERKLRYLARLYHGAPAFPVVAGLETGFESEIRTWLEFAIHRQSTRSSHFSAGSKP